MQLTVYEGDAEILTEERCRRPRVGTAMVGGQEEGEDGVVELSLEMFTQYAEKDSRSVESRGKAK